MTSQLELPADINETIHQLVWRITRGQGFTGAELTAELENLVSRGAQLAETRPAAATTTTAGTPLHGMEIR